jgi:hypothetical protein
MELLRKGVNVSLDLFRRDRLAHALPDGFRCAMIRSSVGTSEASNVTRFVVPRIRMASPVFRIRSSLSIYGDILAMIHAAAPPWALLAGY